MMRHAFGVGWRRAPLAWATIVVVGAALFLAWGLGHPLMLWDESRNVANALEMDQTGFSLVTTYDGRPDLWNTKPPLAVWLMVLSVRLFGTSEWALRLPMLLAAVATVAITLAFAWRLTRNSFVTLAAPLLLLFSFGFYGYHAAWTADYDALLCLFTSAYLFGLFEVIHQRRPAGLAVLGCAFAVALAVLTKDIAGLLPGVGVALYVLVRRRILRLVRNPWYAAGALLAVLVAAAFYIPRELATPGYLARALDNELGSRYAQDQRLANGPKHSAFFYVLDLPRMFGLPPVLLTLLVAPWLKWPKTRATAFMSYGACVCICLLLVLSGSQTRHAWYALPAYPVLAVMTAIVLDRSVTLLGRRLSAPLHKRIGRVVLLVGLAAMVEIGIAVKVLSINAISALPAGGYGRAFSEVYNKGYRRVAAIDHGVVVMDFPSYAPVLHDYALIWSERGLNVTHIEPAVLSAVLPGTAIVSCDPRFTPVLRGRGAQLSTTHGCAAVAAARPSK
jgi:4-amino-4-deoxy-L-arabinose transferase-like glycosyltransferase